MSRKQIFYIFSFIAAMVFISFYITRNRSNISDIKEITQIENDKTENNKIKSDKKSNSESDKNRVDEPQKNETDKKMNEMSPQEYVAWLKDPQDRVLLEIKPEGTSLYRKGNVTITVMANGEELYLPDEF